MSDLERADASVATRFSRLMKATTSPFGVLTDPAIVALGTAIGLVLTLAAFKSEAAPTTQRIAQTLFALPVTIALLVTLSLSSARKRVVAWLASLPFPVENMNAVLNGVGEDLVIRFAGALPKTEALNVELDKVHAEVFVMRSSEEEQLVEVRIGVADSKRNPAGSNHRRFRRVRALVDQVLVPLASEHPIVDVWIK